MEGVVVMTIITKIPKFSTDFRRTLKDQEIICRLNRHPMIRTVSQNESLKERRPPDKIGLSTFEKDC